MRYKDSFWSGIVLLAMTCILYILSVKWIITYIILAILVILALSLIDLGIRGVSFLGERDGIDGYKTFWNYYLSIRK